MFKVISKIPVIATCLFAASALGAEGPPTLRVRSISYAGSACPAGTVFTERAERDTTQVKLSLDGVKAPNGSMSQTRRVNCQLTLDLDYAAGWSYALVRVRAEGEASLPRGASAVFNFRQVSTSQPGLVVRKLIQGPVHDEVAVDGQDFQNVIWSACGMRRGLGVQFDLSVSGNSQAEVSLPGTLVGNLAVEPMPGPLVLGLAWRRCR